VPDVIPPARKALEEALALSGDVLRNVELGELPLIQITLKTSRLARLLNEFDEQRIFEYEAGGYPKESGSLPPESWRLAVAAGRKLVIQDPRSTSGRRFFCDNP